MFDHFPHEPIRILTLSGMVDGTLQFRESAASAIILWREKTLSGTPERTGILAELLIESEQVPETGTRIRWRGKVFQLGSVRVCRNMDGKTVCFRCSVLN